MNVRATALAFVALLSGQAQAAEVQFEGFYQMRGRVFDTLSLDRQLADSEGLSWYVQHRLWLRPKFFITDNVGMFVDVRGFDGMYWGNQQQVETDFSRDDDLPTVFTDALYPMTSETDPTVPLLDISLWRAWAEIHTRIGSFKFGRMPLHWGKGIWQNDGLGLNMDHGDSVDRISWEHIIQNIWLRAGADIHTEGFINDTDDTTSFHLSGAYRTERLEGGLQLMYRRSRAGGEGFDLFMVDGAFDLEFGPINLEGEVIGQFGSGNLDGANNLRLASVGAVLDIGLVLERWRVRLEGGLATGDGNPGDEKLRTFTFDRDYNVGLFMFEQPMPVLEAAVPSEDNGGRNTDVVITGNAVSNALYLKPKVSFQAIKGLWINGSFLAARAAKVPELLQNQERTSYGYEIDLGLDYEGIDHLELSGTFGVFVPGNTYRNFSNESYSGFSSVAFGGQLLARVKF